MKKYRLIKKYPGSEDLGTIFEEYKGYKGDYSQYPEYWEEVIEKSYEILSLNIHDDRISSMDGHTYNYIKCLLNDRLNKIHSIKRLSDNEVFSIGDKIDGLSYKNIVIDDIWLNPNCDSQILFNHKDEGICFNKAKKPKEPLFKTEDGVDIFEGDKFYFVKIKKSKSYDKMWEVSEPVKNDFIYEPEKEVYLSTKEKAEEYILMNKPCLSINDVECLKSICFKDWGNMLKELVKTKLKQN